MVGSNQSYSIYKGGLTNNIKLNMTLDQQGYIV